MKNNDINNIFSDSDCLPEKKLFDYQNNKLSSKEKYLVEKHIANCEFCSDALEGLSLIRDSHHVKKSINDINTAIDKFTYKKKTKTVTLNFSTKLAIAATIAILIGISFLFTHYLRNINNKIIADNNITRNIVDKSVVNPIITNQDSEATIEQTPINNDFFNKKPEQNSTFGGIIEKENVNKYSMPVLLDQPKEKEIIIDNRIDEIETTKTLEVLSKNNQEQNKEEDLKAVNDKILIEELQTIPKNDVDKPINEVNVKDDESKDVSGYKKQVKQKNKITTIGDIVNRKEANMPSTSSSQGNSIIANETYNQALEKFNNKEYNDSKHLFEQIIINDNSNYSALYYKSLCCFFLEENENAITGFNQILKISKGEYYDSAKWYKALALLKKGNKKEAKKILEEIIKSNSSFKNNAELKLKEI